MKTAQLINQDEPFSESPWYGETLDYLKDSLGANDAAPPSESWFVHRDIKASNVIDLPKFKPLVHRPTEFFAAIQEWEGTVTSVEKDYFTADLYDLGVEGEEVTEVAQISFEDIDPQDKPRVQPGAIFRWLIGQSRSRAGTTSRKWVIYFRRAPHVTGQRKPFASLNLPPAIRDTLNQSKEGSGRIDVRRMDSTSTD